MTVFRHPKGKTWRYDFEFRKKRYTGNTHQLDQAAAQLVEREIQLRLRHEAGGIAQFFPEETPRFQDWSEVFLEYKRKHLERPDHVETITRVLLRFWGAPMKPGEAAGEQTPFHDLRLGAPIADPDWILKFEDWMMRRGIGNQSKNHYRGMLRRMFALALKPEYRKACGVATNPFVGVENDPTPGRTVTQTPAEVRRWLDAASYHVRLAIAIAALAPKLRLANVLALDWGVHFDPDPRTTKFSPDVAHYIVIHRHKTAKITRRPLVSPISRQLLRILKDAWRRDLRATRLITYQGKAVKSIRGGVKAAAEDADLVYGRDVADGVTFHTMRHTAATLLTAVEDDPLKLRDAMGHTDLATTMQYRHRKPRHERPSLERLSRSIKIEDLVKQGVRHAPRRATVQRRQGAVQGPTKHDRKKSNKTAKKVVRSRERKTR